VRFAHVTDTFIKITPISFHHDDGGSFYVIAQHLRVDKKSE
jgi:hypothetical protein